MSTDKAEHTDPDSGSESQLPAQDLSPKPVSGLASAKMTGAQTAQGEFPFAIVHGEKVTQLPKDLYIPPEALEVVLETFEGPLDLLLYLIKRQNLDILEINVAEITRQYIGYIEMMEAIKLELAAEYLVMAAMLAEIKSRMLLPRHREVEDEDDPRAELIRRLQEYERFKQAAEDIDGLTRLERDVHIATAKQPEHQREQPKPDVDFRELLLAVAEVMRRAELNEHHHVQLETLSTRERMTDILDRLRSERFLPFISLFRLEEGRLGVVVTFLAMMELVKEALIEIVQNESFGPIHVTARTANVESD